MRKAKITLVDLGDSGCHLFTRGFINDTPVRILIDTGASKTVVSARLLERLEELDRIDLDDPMTAGIGQDKVDAEFVRIPSLIVGGGRMNDLIAGVINIDHVIAMYQNLNIEPFEVILGGDFLNESGAVIDYRKKEIRFGRVPGELD